MSSLKMVVGLGNPGRRYENNRHNIGFRAVELYAEQRNIDLSKNQSKARIGQGWVETKIEVPPAVQEKNARAEANKAPTNPNRQQNERATALSDQSLPLPKYRTLEQKVLLVKPQTYMNNSGEAVQALASYYNIVPADILVIHDHMDLPTGRLRLRPGGGAGGQNGVRSIINRLSTQDFPRLRVGVDRPPGRMDPAAYVLQDFRREEAKIFGELASTVVQIVDTWLFQGIDAAMNTFNGRT